MTRVKNSVVAHARHKKILKQAAGYYGARSRTYRIAYQSVIKSGQYSYRDRRRKKRLFRRLWINRINAASRTSGISYNYLINGLHKSDIYINRKMLAEIAVCDKETFSILVNKVKIGL
ncbi:50S ribosomal protein L20 [Candidatus Blochmannia vicinus (nom. nud.)]|uniref:Large ribosomal subunit protein bL20 n=1 Tax=Candidatus Blochmannia vicinus (nom. nud.) TaxID=251540 RepID=A0A9Q8X1C5_9ENTR|nr:50S ribosomal protein L20 [Candidatus Blochmannia vicinus]URJ28400.1 50S ribosomal protein L20 [Candidatus Blochmannia vicinus]URJ30326.1 50S ribosomal protein L20 [Candidatus Blochmannia vicinus]